MGGKVLVPTQEAVQKLISARLASDVMGVPTLLLARTDAKATEGLYSAIDRAKAYVDAGADAIFPEALHTETEFEAVRKAISVPLLANLTEFGKTPLLTRKQLENLGYNIAIYPVTSLRLAMKAVKDGYAELMRDGTQANLIDKMQTRAQLYKLLRYEDYNRYDQTLYNFKL